MSVKLGLLAMLEAKPGKEADLAAFLEGGKDLASAEPGTVTWYAFKVNDSTYGIFDTFADEEGRQAHLNGRIPEALGAIADEMLAAPPFIRTIDMVAAKAFADGLAS